MLRAAMARPRSEPSFNEPQQWFLATFFGGVVGIAYMLVTSIIDWLRGLMFERYEND
jgi:hypothetical protein